jgi:hypothetical protein
MDVMPLSVMNSLEKSDVERAFSQRHGQLITAGRRCDVDAGKSKRTRVSNRSRDLLRLCPLQKMMLVGVVVANSVTSQHTKLHTW